MRIVTHSREGGSHEVSGFEAVGCHCHKTSVSLEDEFWNGLKQVARARGMTVAELIAANDGNRQRANLSSAIRLFVLGLYRDRMASS